MWDLVAWDLVSVDRVVTVATVDTWPVACPAPCLAPWLPRLTMRVSGCHIQRHTMKYYRWEKLSSNFSIWQSTKGDFLKVMFDLLISSLLLFELWAIKVPGIWYGGHFGINAYQTQTCNFWVWEHRYFNLGHQNL